MQKWSTEQKPLLFPEKYSDGQSYTNKYAFAPTFNIITMEQNTRQNNSWLSVQLHL
jgi:hypothetical protein